MGEGMAARLLTEKIAGTEEKPLCIWNRTKAKCVEMKEKYPDYNVVIKDSAQEVVEASSVTYCMVSGVDWRKVECLMYDIVLLYRWHCRTGMSIGYWHENFS